MTDKNIAVSIEKLTHCSGKTNKKTNYKKLPIKIIYILLTKMLAFKNFLCYNSS